MIETRSLIILIRPVKPKNLGEGNKWNRTVTGIKEDRKEEGDEKQISSFQCLEVLDKEVNPVHSKEHEQGIEASIL